ncbi:MAG TPA: UDP-N-acetylmuramate--L-alanine ligase [Bacteroidales bacterium]|nr:UDP-N-acetylmuramate--L-alanine ligase [Bacteroidales bacterium]
MIDFSKISNIWFIGAGGIGMSALARYFAVGGFKVAGYDRVETSLTRTLNAEGINIIYKDDIAEIPGEFRDKAKTLVIYTPAVPRSNKIFSYLSTEGFNMHKRSVILGIISQNTRTIAIAGTHGKTSVSTITAHLLKQSDVDCSAFLGGISKNYQTNMLTGESNITVMEADEFDRSFHCLEPEIALITSMDADHLDVYETYDNMVKAYEEFAGKIKDEGILVLNEKISGKIRRRGNIKTYTYGFSPTADFYVSDISTENQTYSFRVNTPWGVIDDLKLLIAGRMNIENSLGAIALAMLAGVKDNEIRKALIYYKGVARRFDIRIDSDKIIYIDDYAHHPEEIDYCIESVREFYGKRKVTGIFQPHLYTRTRDHAEGFAASLDKLDSVILLPVYAAREKPVSGVGTEMIYEKMKLENKMLARKDEVTWILESMEIDILLTLGAGDIDKLVEPIETMLRKKLS